VERAAVVLGVSGSVEVATAEERVRPAASEVEVLRADASRAADLLGWQPRVTLEQGLARTAEWLRGRVVAGEAGRYHR
jgi:UDP-glucose 4-epimerase